MNEPGVTLHLGDALETLRSMRAGSIHCCITSPPYYGLRDYDVAGQIGLEPTPEAYVARMTEVFREVRRVLADDGTLWLNVGDSYTTNCEVGRKDCGKTSDPKCGPNEKWDHQGPRRERRVKIDHGLKPKDLIGVPWRLAFALQADGWYLRSDIIWHKPNPMPESVRDRPTKAHEYLFLLAKSARYYYDADAVREPFADDRNVDPGEYTSVYRVGSGRMDGNSTCRPTKGQNGRNRRSVWTVAPRPFKGAHFAVMPEALVEPCVKAGCPPGGTVLDPFAGSGTVGVVARRLGRHFTGIELNPEYHALGQRRLDTATRAFPLFCEA